MDSQGLERSVLWARRLALSSMLGAGLYHHLRPAHIASGLLLAAVLPLASTESGPSQSFRTLTAGHLTSEGVLWEADALSFRITAVAGDTRGILGYPAQQWLDDPDFWLNHISAEDRERVLTLCIAAIEGGQDNLRLEYRAVDASGGRTWVENTLHVLRDRDGRAQRLLGRMVSLADQNRTTEFLRQSQKMEEIGRLTSGVAHDFSNLLTVIGGHADLLLASLDPQDSRRASIEEIKKAGERAATLTRQLLSLSRRRPATREPLDLGAVVVNLGRMLRRLIGEHIELVTHSTLGLPPILADAGQIEQVILNLVVNGRDAMAGGGILRVETGECEVTSLKSGSLVPAGRYVTLTVKDAGCGMDATTLSRIYEPFFTTKEPGRGTGLGLATVKEIVRDCGGHIEVESAVGSGTTFRLYFPVAEGGKAPGPIPLAPATARRGCETVLLVEDEKNVLAMCCQLLDAYGYRVLEAASGEDAVRLVDEYPGKVDLLLADVVMPGMNGRDLADVLTAHRPGLKVLFMSGYTRDAVLRHAFPHPEVPYLQKPFTPQALAAAVRLALDGQDPAQSASWRRAESKPRLV